jgi:hypothetical protein
MRDLTGMSVVYFFWPVLLWDHRPKNPPQRAVQLPKKMANQMSLRIELKVFLHETTGIDEVGRRGGSDKAKSAENFLLSRVKRYPCVRHSQIVSVLPAEMRRIIVIARAAETMPPNPPQFGWAFDLSGLLCDGADVEEAQKEALGLDRAVGGEVTPGV